MIGKAAVLLLVLAGVKRAYATVMSESGLLLRHLGFLRYRVSIILNRAGPCPMEEAMDRIKDPVRALVASAFYQIMG